MSYIPGITDYSYNILQSFSADGIETVNHTRSGGVWTLRESNMYCVCHDFIRFLMIVHNFDYPSAIVGGQWCSDKPFIRDAPCLFYRKKLLGFLVLSLVLGKGRGFFYQMIWTTRPHFAKSHSLSLPYVPRSPCTPYTRQRA